MNYLILLLIFRSINSQVLEGVLKTWMAGETQYRIEPPDSQILLPEYDFIVVGAGTAGCVVANRLTENPNWNVLLIEAGRHENYLMDIPILANYLQFTDANWKFRTQPSGNFCLAMDNNQCHFPRGKVMGGSSVLNYMLYSRGNHEDFDRWARSGNDGWSYDDVLPYFKKIEDFQIPEMNDPKYHHNGGYLTVSYPPYRTKIAEAIVKSGIEMGLKYVDYNAREMIGISYSQASVKDGIRHSSSRAYLHPISSRPNLFVKKFAHVKKILIEPNTKRAYGVEFVKNGVTQVARAKMEVIISAGAIGSPQLLMLSGIGPRNHLKSVGIRAIQNLKVGYNLMDHIACGGITFLVNDSISLKTERMFERQPLSDYLNYHKGPLSVPGGLEACSFHNTDDPNNPDGYPNMELFYLGGSMVSDSTLYKNFAIRDDIYNDVYGSIKGRESYMIFPMLLRPKSRGRIMLKDNNYKSHPLIYPNYFSDPYDIRVMLQGIDLILNITSQPPLKKIESTLYTKPIPQCAKHSFGSPPYWECMARHFTLTIYHQSGTCKMGPRSDKSAVVDPRLRVHGIKSLRVIDASIMPEIPAAHTNAPTYMIAEKGSDMIKQDWGFIQ
ncbi:glucose dehydrogenase [FAD, quinone]-like [Onthophagus taurus]|uniref:glucose dehydrogenase [FAD, quinone]-like n=1 Tax=Onthophagus taurus TaxID=166361 RepID=UPI0039BDF466